MRSLEWVMRFLDAQEAGLAGAVGIRKRANRAW